jgi:DNA-binding MarR family transcriptional regulator
MNSSLAVPRTEAAEHVATTLLPQASLLLRLVAKRAHWTVSRSEGSVLRTLNLAGPQRITALAELEGLAQPSMTILVKRLEERGWVVRDRHAGDGRVWLVSITPAGREALDEFRGQYHAVLRAQLANMTDDEVAALVQATQALAGMVEHLQQGAAA